MFSFQMIYLLMNKQNKGETKFLHYHWRITMEYVVLSNGVKMPQLGYGVYQVTKDECERCVLDALKAGYRFNLPTMKE